MDCRQYYETEGLHGLYERDVIRFQRTMSHILSEGNLLDVGCREGYWLQFLQDQTALANVHLAGVDISKPRIQAARQLLNHELSNNDGHPSVENSLSTGSISLCVADARQLPFEDNLFTQVTAMETIEHIPEWRKALEELVRVSSSRVVITVPYHEQLKYVRCGSCGSKAPLYGHLHRFTEEDFLFLRQKGDVTFDFFPHPFGFGHYVGRALKAFTQPKVFRKGQQVASPLEGNSKGILATVCPTCYDHVPYTKYVERGAELLAKLATRKPEYLLVRVDT